MKKKNQRVFAVILAVLVSVSLVGSAVFGYFYGGGVPNTNTSASANASDPVADYASQKARVEGLAQQAKANPANVQLQTDLGNAYYDLGMAAQEAAPTEMQADLKLAIEAYQNVLKTNKDPNVMVDMATAAFYSGENDLAEKSFKEALAIKPDFYNALFNYGIFLSHIKQDWAGAITQWKKAENVAQNSADKDRIKGLISQAQDQLQATLNNGTSNPATNGVTNPALNSGANPATSGK